MTTFFVVSAILASLAVAFLAWPLLRRPRAAPDAPRAGAAATVVAALVPAAAFGIYLWASNWTWEPPTAEPQFTQADLERVVQELQRRLAQQPEDVKGWKILGRSATVLGDYPLARQAFGEAYTRTQGRDPEALIGYAEALVLNDEREIDGHAATLFEQALEMAPEDPRALWYGGIIAYRRGDLALAEKRWVELQNQQIAPDLRAFLAERLSEIEGARGAPGAAPASAIHVTIDVAPDLRERAPSGAALFVIARRGAGGPPIAVTRRAVGAWPIEVTLSDADAMLPGTVLAQGGPVTLVARISRSGEPLPRSGDLFGEVGYDFASATPAQIVIDRTVP